MNLHNKPVKFVEGCEFCEGPAFGPDGLLYFVNLKGGWIGRAAEPGQLRRFAASPKPNGGQFDANGNFVVAECGQRAIVRFAPDGSMSTIASEYQGKPFNGPNDLAIDSDGGLYFTDPEGSSIESRTGAVYHVSAQGKVTRVADGLAYPNGINITSDRRAVVVAETLTHDVHRFTRQSDGTLGPRDTLCHIDGGVGPDGMCYDRDGNLYVAWYGSACIYVISSTGTVLGKIDLPGANPTNCCFGPPASQWETSLFIAETETNIIYRCDVGVPGMPLHHAKAR